MNTGWKEELIQLPFSLRLHVQPSTVSQNTHRAGELLQSPKCKASSFNVKTKQTRVGVSSKQSSLLVKRTARALCSVRSLRSTSPRSEERQPERKQRCKDEKKKIHRPPLDTQDWTVHHRPAHPHPMPRPRQTNLCLSNTNVLANTNYQNSLSRRLSAGWII